LKRLDFWHVKRKTPSPAHALPVHMLSLFDDSPSPGVDDLFVDPQYPDDLTDVIPGEA